MTEQFEYIADKAAERKTAMVVQAGDWVNKEEFEDEWQWRNAEPSAQALEGRTSRWPSPGATTTTTSRTTVARC